jgi:hypothetical protein
VSWLGRFESWLAQGDAQAAAFATADPATSNGSTSAIAPAASTWRAQSVARNVALSFPAMRKARAAILTPATFGLTAWEGGAQLADQDPRCAFLRQPEPTRPRFNTLALLLDDGLWHDKAVIKATRTVYGTTAYIERIHPQRWTPTYTPSDPDTVLSWRVDDRHYTPDQFAAAGFLAFDFAALGGLRRFGWELLSLYGDLQRAAGRYARAPHPHAILQDAGPDLDDDEITKLLDDWEWARENRSTGYLNGMEYKPVGYSAKELQLTEAREHAALEVARLVQLPAFAVDASGGDSMTYANIIDRRRDLVAALRPWTTVITQTLSLNYRPASGAPAGLLLPRTVSVEFDASDYLRDDAAARMGVWKAGTDLGIFDEADIRRMEPLARKATA